MGGWFKFNQRFWTPWRNYRARMLRLSNVIENPLPSGSDLQLPSRVRLRFSAVDGDCEFSISLSGTTTTYYLPLGRELTMVVQANATIETDANTIVEVDLGHFTSEFRVIIGEGIPTSDGYGLQKYGIDPYGR